MTRAEIHDGPGGGRGVRPELELLLRSGSAALSRQHAGPLATWLRHEIDWDMVLRLADAHGMAPLLYYHLRGAHPDAVPQAVLSLLQTRVRGIALRNLSLTSELLKLLKLFTDNRITAVPYKGPTLAALAYGNLALREFVDLDILIRREDLGPASQLLLGRHYRPALALSGPRERAYLNFSHERGFVREDEPLLVELQWHFAEPFFGCSLDPAALRERLVPVALASKQVLTFAPEDQLLILCFHGFRHLWGQLKWICDVAWLIEGHPALDWERILEQAQRTGSTRILLLGLALAADLLGTRLPEPVRQRIRGTGEVMQLAAQVRSRICGDSSGPAGFLESTLFYLRARERLRDRIRHCLSLALTPTVGDAAWLSLPPGLFGLYYVLRPVRLAGQYGLGRLLPKSSQ